jgi:nitrogen fixation NifU-like protein
MSELTDLYQDVILDHNKRPRNFGRLAAPNRAASGDNPLCGDRLDLEVEVRDGKVEDIAFTGAGCAISTASASLMTEAVAGKSAGEALALQNRFHKLVTEREDEADPSGLGKLEALAGVRDYPVRIKCATLAWHALKAALESKENESRRVSTE